MKYSSLEEWFDSQKGWMILQSLLVRMAVGVVAFGVWIRKVVAEAGLAWRLDCRSWWDDYW
jgi:hypothetical protein